MNISQLVEGRFVQNLHCFFTFYLPLHWHRDKFTKRREMEILTMKVLVLLISPILVCICAAFQQGELSGLKPTQD